MIQLDKREAFPFSSNPFGLVYENAITENKENEVQIHPITYQLNGIINLMVLQNYLFLLHIYLFLMLINWAFFLTFF